MTTQLMRYVGLEVLSAIVLASFALVGLLAVFTVLEEVQDFRNQYQFFEALTFVALSLPRLFYETIPFSVLIGGLVGLGGLAARSMERVGATWVVAAAGAWQPGRAWAGTGGW